MAAAFFISKGRIPSESSALPPWIHSIILHPIMVFPQTHKLACPPVGVLDVIFDISNDDDDFYVTDASGVFATSEILAGWDSVWSKSLPMLDELLEEYAQETTAGDLLSIPGNTLNVMILPLEDDEDDCGFRFDLFINRQTRAGSVVFAVEFTDLEPHSTSAVF